MSAVTYTLTLHSCQNGMWIFELHYELQLNYIYVIKLSCHNFNYCLAHFTGLILMDNLIV